MVYEEVIKKIERLGRVEYVGNAVSGTKLPLLHIERQNQPARVLLAASIHAREHITTDLVIALLESYLGSYSIDCLPVINPDGVKLCCEGADWLTARQKSRLVALNGGSDFSLWKANLNGVDLNVNFDADWGEGMYNVTIPSAENYIGLTPFSEPETAAVKRVLDNNYAVAVSYHSKGEEVYWGYEHNFRHYQRARCYAENVGYALKRSENSCGGLKDYYALNFSGLGLTVEIGEDRFPHPYPISELDNLINKHANSIDLLCQIGEELAQIHGGSDN